jgi:poly(A) polymerase
MPASKGHPPASRPCRFPEQQPRIEAAVRVCQHLHANGHEALFAGGCVRDFLLNRPIQDIDIATSAYPEVVQALFPGSLAVGKAFGVILIPWDAYRFEVATFRVDSKTSDGRRPDSVVFSNAEADAFRRDFTVNSLFYDVRKHRVLDFTGGLADLDAHLIQTVGPPAERFQEDYLRMLRAIRFTHVLHFTLDPQARETIIRKAHLVDQLPVERIHHELEVLFAGTQVPGKALEDLIETGIWGSILQPVRLESIPPGPLDSKGRASMIATLNASAPAAYWEVLAYYVFCMEFTRQPFTPQAVQKMGFSKDQSSTCAELIQSLRPFTELRDLDNYQLCKLANRKIYTSLIKMIRAEMTADDETEGLAELDTFEQKAQSFVPSPEPWISGGDLIQANIPEGPKRSRILEASFRLQLIEQLPDRTAALKWLRQ